jgi:hypothetical protein
MATKKKRFNSSDIVVEDEEIYSNPKCSRYQELRIEVYKRARRNMSESNFS